MKKDYLIIIPIFILLTIIILLSTNHIYLIDNFYNKIVIHNQIATNIFKLITNFGSFIGIAIIFILLLIFSKNKQYLKDLLLILILSTILNNILKIIFSRERPDLVHLVIENTYSFPSGHASAAMTFYGYLIYQLLKKNIKKKYKIILTILLTILILLIGYSRVYLNVHYISDVLAGFMISLILLYIFIKYKNHHFSITRKAKI